jgi:hypothetical protein
MASQARQRMGAYQAAGLPSPSDDGDGPPSLHSMTPPACRPVGSGVMRQAITLFLGRSSPAPWLKITSTRHRPGRRGGQDSSVSRVYLACSTAPGRLATVLGAIGYPDPRLSPAHSTRRETTSAPAPNAGIIAACLDSYEYNTFACVLVPSWSVILMVESQDVMGSSCHLSHWA